MVVSCSFTFGEANYNSLPCRSKTNHERSTAPSTEQFDAQDAAYKQSLLPAGVPKLAIEAAHTDFWYKYVGIDGDVVGMQTFGESAPGGVLLEHFGFTVENVVAKATALLN